MVIIYDPGHRTEGRNARPSLTIPPNIVRRNLWPGPPALIICAIRTGILGPEKVIRAVGKGVASPNGRNML
jgi:hypothetical protein